MEEAAFEQLTDGLHVAAATRFRDSWVACDKCDRWREIPPTPVAGAIGASAWRCAFACPARRVRGAGLTDGELKAFSVAAKGHALALRAEKRGTDIQNGAAEAEATRRRRCRWRRTRGRPAPRRRWTRGRAAARGRPRAARGGGRWRRREDDTRDAGRATR